MLVRRSFMSSATSMMGYNNANHKAMGCLRASFSFRVYSNAAHSEVFWGI